MTDTATITPISAPPLLDLCTFDVASRPGAWKGAASTLFPGLSVDTMDTRPALGMIRDTAFGPGRALSVLSPPAVVDYRPSERGSPLYDSMSLVISLHGTLWLAHRRAESRLTAGDVCVVDGRHPFRMRVREGAVEILVLQVPRVLVAGLEPILDRFTGQRLDGGDPGVVLLREFVLQSVQGRPWLSHEQCHTVLAAVARMLTLPLQAVAAIDHGMDGRVRAAVAAIESRLCDVDLGADCIAAEQRVSRRRLDQLFSDALGCTLTGYVWERRLSLAEGLLRDPVNASVSVTQIALSCGFKSPSHFTRMFRRRHGATPQQWRLAQAPSLNEGRLTPH